MNEYIIPISENNPVGENIEYDELYQNLLHVLSPKSEQQFGDVVIEAGQTNWNEVYSISEKILQQKSKDLNVMSYFTQSKVVLEGLSGLAFGLDVIYQNLQQYWDDLYPLLKDEDGEYDPDYRVNALSIFCSHDGIIKQIKDAFLVTNGLTNTKFSVKDIETILDKDTEKSAQYHGGIERLNVDLKLAMEEKQKQIVGLESSVESLKKIKKIYDAHIAGNTLNFDLIEATLLKILSFCLNGNEVETQEELAEVTEAVVSSKKEEKKVNLVNLQISSRQDVELLLEKIYIYFQRNEPSHPAPLFIRRIQKLMNFDFYEIMKDISPESLDRLELLVGQKVEDDESF